jgi:hypothetical protein
MICKGVQPIYNVTAWNKIDSDTNNGWVINCYTGIMQCAVSQTKVDGFTLLDNTNATETADCMNDPRYLTWRSYVMKIDVDGTIDWYRTDSYWNSGKTKFSSTWGTRVALSTNVISADDNIGTTTSTKAKTFVFAYSDGSGVQLNHISVDYTAHASNSTASSGTNALTTAPASFKNDSPN